MFDLNIGQRLQCTNIEKKECIELLNRILELAETARKYGLLALEQEIEKFSTYFMKKALMFITDGMDPENIRTILQNYIVVGDYKGKALLERILMMEGVLLIQAGENPLIIKEKLASYFGEEFIPEIFIEDMSPEDRIKAYYSKIMDAKSRLKESVIFDEAMLGLDSRSLQRVLREMNVSDVINVLCDASGKLQIFLLDNLSQKLAVTIINELSNVGQTNDNQVIASQNIILDIIKKLREQGEII